MTLSLGDEMGKIITETSNKKLEVIPASKWEIRAIEEPVMGGTYPVIEIRRIAARMKNHHKRWEYMDKEEAERRINWFVHNIDGRSRTPLKEPRR